MHDIHKRFSLLVKLTFDTQMEACQAWGISATSQLKRYMTGTHPPHAYIMRAISRYGYSADWLLTGQGAMFTSDTVGSKLKTRIVTNLKRGDYPKATVQMCPKELIDAIRPPEGGQWTDIETQAAQQPGLPADHPAAMYTRDDIAYTQDDITYNQDDIAHTQDDNAHTQDDAVPSNDSSEHTDVNSATRQRIRGARRAAAKTTKNDGD